MTYRDKQLSSFRKNTRQMLHNSFLKCHRQEKGSGSTRIKSVEVKTRKLMPMLHDRAIKNKEHNRKWIRWRRIQIRSREETYNIMFPSLILFSFWTAGSMSKIKRTRIWYLDKRKSYWLSSIKRYHEDYGNEPFLFLEKK